jgi:hypothetical protein
MEFAVLIAAAGVLPASHRAVCPTNPCESVPDTPAMGSDLADGDVVVVPGVVLVVVEDDGAGDSSSDVGVVVTVVVDGGGTASLVCGADPPSCPLKANTAASATATMNITAVAATSATCVRLNRDFLAGGSSRGIGPGIGW